MIELIRFYREFPDPIESPRVARVAGDCRALKLLPAFFLYRLYNEKQKQNQKREVLRVFKLRETTVSGYLEH